MAFNAAEFRSKMRYGGARPNLYEVTLSFPSDLGEASEIFTFMCRSASLPGMMIGTAPTSYFGRTVKFAGDRQFEDWNVQVYNDEDFKVRNAFEAWQNRMSLLDHNTKAVENMCSPGPEAYYVDITVKQLGKDGGLCGHGNGGDGLKTYTLKNAWPNQSGPIELAWDANDQIETFSVNFTYDYFITDKIEGLSDSI